MNDLVVDIFVPALCSLPLTDDNFELFERAKDDLLNACPFFTDIYPELAGCDIVFEAVTDKAALPENISNLVDNFSWRQATSLRFKLITNVANHLDLAKDASQGQQGSHILVDLSVRFEKFVCDLLLLTNLAKPGAIQTEQGCILINGVVSHSLRGFVGGLEYAVGVADEVGWPRITELSLSEMFKWANPLLGFEDGIGRGSLGRALASLSHIIKGSIFGEPTMNIMWAMLALEGLYCSGNTDLSRQLREKTEVFLGKQEQYTKRLNQAYAFRSRFVHGDIDFPFEYSPYDASPDYAKFETERWAAEHFIVAVLIATLQKMCVEKRTHLEFNYVLAATLRTVFGVGNRQRVAFAVGCNWPLHHYERRLHVSVYYSPVPAGDGRVTSHPEVRAGSVGDLADGARTF